MSPTGGSKPTIKKRRLNNGATMAKKEAAIAVDDLSPPPIQTGKKRMAVKQEVIEIDDSDSDSDSSPSPVRTGSPLRPIFCLKNKEEIKKFEEEEECFILEFDPYNNSDVLKLTNAAHDFNAESELSIVAEKGQVACRDYPHPRNACAVFPFEKTPHDKHCKMCHCYVCDLSAPCSKWTGTSGHCHAFNNEGWNSEKHARRIFTKAA